MRLRVKFFGQANHERPLICLARPITTAIRNRCAERTRASDALPALTLVDRNICLVRDLDPARRFQTHQLSELLRCHGFGFGPLVGEKRAEFG
jgi:hypothetical protein